MIALLYCLLALVLIYGLYFSSRVSRTSKSAADFLDANLALPGWVLLFCLPGLVAVGLGIERQLMLIGQFGLQANHVSIGIVLAAIVAMLVWNRFWLISRIFGTITPTDALGIYYKSGAMRVIMLALTVLFVLPFTANILSSTSELMERASFGVMPRSANIWLLSFVLSVTAIVGGWRGAIFSIAMQSILLAVLIPTITLVVEIISPSPGFPKVPIDLADGILWDMIPGVIQNTQGIGKSVPTGGIYTTVGIASSIVALLGIVLSPMALFLAQTVRSGNCLGISAVWTTGGVLSGIFLIAFPVLVVRLSGNWIELSTKLFDFAPLAAGGLILLHIIGSLILVNFFVTGGVILLIRDLIAVYFFPGLNARQIRFSARIGLGFAFFFLALLASFAPYVSTILSTVVLPLSVQSLPAILGITFLRWISAGAVLAGFSLGSLIVLFTEPLGLLLFESLFLDLPWGRWPLTIHSAVWGLVFNSVLVVLISAATLKSSNWLQRDQVHEAIIASSEKSRAAKGLLWSLFLSWGFLAYGPGAILGNTFFTKPIFTEVEAQLGVPSIWVWQILFWLLGLLIIWWLAFKMGFGRLTSVGLKTFKHLEVEQRGTPQWIASALNRVKGKPLLDKKHFQKRQLEFPQELDAHDGSRKF